MAPGKIEQKLMLLSRLKTVQDDIISQFLKWILPELVQDFPQ